jgi:hypothetical protein
MFMFLLTALSFAERPTEGGLFAYDSTDTVETYDEGMIRVHYSSSGSNVAIMDDLDGSGIPDYVELVAHTANDVLEFYAGLGFLYPLSESDVGLNNLGGTSAFDFYLVDFGGNSDGMFGVDGCRGTVCAGHMVMENDFRGYGYPSLEEATDVLVSHELFHAVQAAYNANQPSWLSEGSAVWAEWVYNPEVQDFINFSAAYLSETERSIHKPPSGMTTAFSYGTALFFAFWDEYYAEETSRMLTLQESLVGLAEEEMIIAVTEQMDDVALDWMTFSKWNLATNLRSGEMESYSFAGRLFGLQSELEGEIIEDDYRFYPLATTYFELEHGGGECTFAYQGEDEDVQFALHPVVSGDKVGPAIKEWRIGDEPIWTEELEVGEYWVIGTLPILTSNSQKIEFCLGADCVIPEVEDTTDVEPIPKSGCQTQPLSIGFWMMWSLMGVRFRKGYVA